jgi:hypothetical protein
MGLNSCTYEKQANTSAPGQSEQAAPLPEETKPPQTSGEHDSTVSPEPEPLADAETTRIGEVARRLSAADLETLATMLPLRVTPWLIAGEPGQQQGVQRVDVFLPSEEIRPELRRGRVVRLGRNVRPAGPGPWMAIEGPDDLGLSSGLYARVPAEGRGFVDVQDVTDVNQPFFVVGHFEEEELIALVRWIRETNPVRAGRPIVSVSRQADTAIRVWFRVGRLKWESIDVRGDGARWIVTGHGGAQA